MIASETPDVLICLCVFVYGPKGGNLLGNAKLHSSGQTQTCTHTPHLQTGQDVMSFRIYRP